MILAGKPNAIIIQLFHNKQLEVLKNIAKYWMLKKYIFHDRCFLCRILLKNFHL